MKKQVEAIFCVFEAAAAKLAMLTLVCAVAVTSMHAQSSKEPIRIGAILSITGPGAGLGMPERDGILLAAKTINGKGGVNGRPIEVIVEDDGSNADTALSKANALVYGQKVKALLAASLTANTVAAGSITSPLQLLQISFSGLGPAVEFQRLCDLHIAPPQEMNARAMLAYATEALGAKKIAVLNDSGYGQLVLNALKQVAPEYGVEIGATEKFEIGATDVTTQAAKIRASQPQAVFIIATSATPFRAVKQVKISVPIIGAIGSSTYDYVKGMGDAADGIVFAEFVVAENPLPYQRDFVEIYKREYHTLPKNNDAFGWDALFVAAKAIGKAGPKAANQAVCNAARGPFQGVTTKYDFSAKDMTGIPLSGYVYSKLVKGKYTRLDFKAK